MKDYRVLFEPAASDGLLIIIDITAQDLDDAAGIVKIYLFIIGEKFKSCKFFEQYRGAWRWIGAQINFNNKNE